MIKFYSEYFLSNSEVKKACEIFNISGAITDKYLNNFKIYCLILEDKKEQAQLLFDLSKQLDEIDTFYENKINETQLGISKCKRDIIELESQISELIKNSNTLELTFFCLNSNFFAVGDNSFFSMLLFNK